MKYTGMPWDIWTLITPLFREQCREEKTRNSFRCRHSGYRFDISVVDGWTQLECCSFDAYNEAGNLQEMAERFRAREGHYPSRILADKIYRNRENLSYCKAHGIRLSGPALGRPKKGETRDKAQDDRDECERVEVERRFSLAKRKCGMGWSLQS